MARKCRLREDLKEVGALVERLRDFIRLNYTTAAEAARQIGVRDTTIYDWLLGKARPAKPERITAFLNSLPKTMDPASLQPDMSTANTRTGAVSLSLAVARSVNRRRVRSEDAVGDFQPCVQIAMRKGRSGKATMRRCGLGMGRVKIDLNNESPIGLSLNTRPLAFPLPIRATAC